MSLVATDERQELGQSHVWRVFPGLETEVGDSQLSLSLLGCEFTLLPPPPPLPLLPADPLLLAINFFTWPFLQPHLHNYYACAYESSVKGGVAWLKVSCFSSSLHVLLSLLAVEELSAERRDEARGDQPPTQVRRRSRQTVDENSCRRLLLLVRPAIRRFLHSLRLSPSLGSSPYPWCFSTSTSSAARR